MRAASYFRGRKIYEPPRYMSVSLAAQQLVEIVENRRRQGQELGQIYSNQLEHWVVESCNVCFVLVFFTFKSTRRSTCTCRHKLYELYELSLSTVDFNSMSEGTSIVVES